MKTRVYVHVCIYDRIFQRQAKLTQGIYIHQCHLTPFKLFQLKLVVASKTAVSYALAL